MDRLTRTLDPVKLQIFRNLFSSVAEEMGVTLGRTAFSVNIKERRDFSCAFFDEAAKMVAQAAHIPVHLGSMPLSVQTSVQLFDFVEGDVVILNDPYLGGTHLPDVTFVTPIFAEGELIGFLGSRAHQADIGGMTPGSMPMSTEIYQEGVIIPPLKIVEAGRLNEPLMQLICRNVRTPEERRGDFEAQMAAHRVGEQRVKEMIARYGLAEVREQMAGLLDYAERLTRQAISEIPDGEYSFADFLDDDGQSDEPVPLRVTVRVRGDTLEADFSGSSPQRPGCLNAVLAVTKSAVYYVVRCLAGEHIPTNEGAFRPITVIAPRGSLLDAEPPAAVAGGNVETSQRIVDVVLGALAQALPDRAAAASQGTMNNLTMGGADPFRGQQFAYYETMGGGTGAGAPGPGLSGVHSHMSNTMNTPIEALEYAMPFRIRRYAIRRGSGGSGRHRGGDGLIREYEFLTPATVTLLSERRRFSPYGLAGGTAGATGENVLTRDCQATKLPGKVTFTARANDILSVHTPGGGGWGEPDEPAVGRGDPGVAHTPETGVGAGE